MCKDKYIEELKNASKELGDAIIANTRSKIILAPRMHGQGDGLYKQLMANKLKESGHKIVDGLPEKADDSSSNNKENL